MKTILVTGANGQLGNELRDMAGEYPQYRFVFTDVAELDICSRAAVDAFVEECAADIAVNCAAYTAVDKAESDEAKAALVNSEAPANLAQAMERRGGRLVQISTDYVFPGTAHKPIGEDEPAAPVSAYGRTKLAGERAAQAACRDTIIIRTAWLYSTYGHNFVKTMIKLGQERDSLGVVADQIGTPTYARDLARAIMLAIGKGVKPGVYNFTDEGTASWYDFAVEIQRLATGGRCRVRPLHTADYPTPAQRPHYSLLDKTKITKATGMEIPHWTDSLRECVEALQKQDNR